MSNDCQFKAICENFEWACAASEGSDRVRPLGCLVELSTLLPYIQVSYIQAGHMMGPPPVSTNLAYFYPRTRVRHTTRGVNDGTALGIIRALF